MGYFDDNPITKSPYISDVDLLWHPDYKKKKIALDFTGAEGGCIKAGSPISAAGAVANDDNAVGILLHDCYDGFQPYGSVVIDGFVKENVAQEHSGVELSDEAKRSMSKLVFVDASGVVDPPAGGSDPVLANAKETGGIGWTESFSIDWDGDTTDKPHFSITLFGEEFNYYKVAEKTINYLESAIINFGGEAGEIAPVTGDGVVGYAGIMPVVMVADGGEFSIFGIEGNAPTSGIYFLSLDGSCVESFTSDTVHTIDPKYISGGGGAMVVHFELSAGPQGFSVTADKTPDEVLDAMRNGIVYGVATGIMGNIPLGTAFFDTSSIGFMIKAAVADHVEYIVESDGDGWMLSL